MYYSTTQLPFFAAKDQPPAWVIQFSFFGVRFGHIMSTVVLHQLTTSYYTSKWSLRQTAEKQSYFNVSCSACTTGFATNHRRQEKAFKAISPLSHISKCQNKGQTLHTSSDVDDKGTHIKNYKCHLKRKRLVFLVITSPGRGEVQLFNSSQRPYKNETSAASVAHQGCLLLKSCSLQTRWAHEMRKGCKQSQPCLWNFPLGVCKTWLSKRFR